MRDPKKEYYYNEFRRRLALAINRINPDVIITSGATSTVTVLEMYKKMMSLQYEATPMSKKLVIRGLLLLVRAILMSNGL